MELKAILAEPELEPLNPPFASCRPARQYGVNICVGLSVSARGRHLWGRYTNTLLELASRKFTHAVAVIR
jgi:hypothetical protein